MATPSSHRILWLDAHGCAVSVIAWNVDVDTDGRTGQACMAVPHAPVGT